jgi:hypothetical protein
MSIIDRVVPAERLFRLSFDEVRKLNQDMFQQSQFEGIAISQLGAAYVLNFLEQRKVVDALLWFIQSNPSYNPLADGQLIHAWIRAHGESINRSSLLNAFRAVRALDNAVVIEPPTITTQPADAAIEAGEPAAFSVTVTGTSPFTYQWRKNGEAIVGATKAQYVTAATEFSNGSKYTVTVSNAAGSVTSSPATLRTVMKSTNFSR